MSSYKDHKRMLGIDGVEIVHSYAEQAAIRMGWHYGERLPQALVAQKADVAAWNGLGEKRRTA